MKKIHKKKSPIAKKQSVSNGVKKSLKLPPLLKRIGKLADANRLRAYLIGGSVRDMLLGARTFDWDVTVEGDPSKIVYTLAGKLKGSVKAYPMFGTFVLELPGGKHIDFATARTEFYREPGTLPIVKFSLLPRDVSRRDFSVNALALALNGPEKGKIIDLCGGLKDLKTKTLRVLHDRSFRDDPTRIFRLARFAGRGYKIESKTEEQVHRCLNFVELVSPARVREELMAILKEKDPRGALFLLVSWGVVGRALPELIPGIQHLDVKKAKTPEERLTMLLYGMNSTGRQEFLLKFMFERVVKRKIEELSKMKKFKVLVSALPRPKRSARRSV
ncbi:MAG: hypothetical protein ABII64_06850 [Elusimicrobiota bacterium]